MILVGDIGGTKTVLALAEATPQGSLELRQVRELSSGGGRDGQGAEDFEPLLQSYLESVGSPPLDVLCLGVAGPVVRGRCAATNLPWVLEESALARAVGARRARLLNDLEATAYGLLRLGSERTHLLQGSSDEGGDAASSGPLAVLAAGTGLGEAMLLPLGGEYVALPTEGGHADFAPRSELEVELWRWLRARLGGRVSLERVVSGPGLQAIHTFLREHRRAPCPAWLAERLAHPPTGRRAGRSARGRRGAARGALSRANPATHRRLLSASRRIFTKCASMNPDLAGRPSPIPNWGHSFRLQVVRRTASRSA